MSKLAKVKIDKFGRVLIPKEIREKLGIKENNKLEIEVKEDTIHLSQRNSALEDRVGSAVEYLRKNAPQPFTSEEEVEEKWYTRDYSFKKIGLKE